MTSRYHDTPRNEILPYVPERCARVLEFGCGTGATISAIRTHRSVEWAGGLERDAGAAERARAVLDRVWEGDAETSTFDRDIAAASLDLVLCLDVLEHLVDPWTMVTRIAGLLAPGGRLVISVPNIRHYKFISNLFFKGDFHYRDAGLLDRTHLRFFVRDTAIDLATRGGLKLVTCDNAHPPKAGDMRWLMSKLSAGGLDPLMTKQYVVVSANT
ncbi:MAG: methyltransferase domain-containing protein [Proteobacteria bacterium]|nr:methyltransferase domain-containing protein [Pseudomonadota bacterium]